MLSLYNSHSYTINPHDIDLAAKIAEKVRKLKGTGAYSRNLRLRKINSLRSFQSSLAIENNTLTLGQVTRLQTCRRCRHKPTVVRCRNERL
jgi:Fic family protein